MAQAIATDHGCEAKTDITTGYPVTINHPAQTQYSQQVAERVVGKNQLIPSEPPSLASEDFSFFLEKVPGCYIWIGNGDMDGTCHSCSLHNPNYDFNDELLPIGASLFTQLVMDHE